LHQDTTASAGSVYAFRGIPPAGQLIPLGLQHVVAAVVGVITPALITFAVVVVLNNQAGGIIAQGLSSILGAFVGGLPTASYSQNVGIVTLNKVINRAVFTLAALVMLVAGFVPKFSAALTTIPQSVIGGATLSVFATITMTGIQMFTQGGFTARKKTMVGLSVALGVGITQVAGCLQGEGFPGWVNTVFGSSAVVVSAFMAIIFNLTLPKEEAGSPA